jgi:hypothetical protein
MKAFFIKWDQGHFGLGFVGTWMVSFFTVTLFVLYLLLQDKMDTD